MRTCPLCQASFPDDFQYCPNDTQPLSVSEEEGSHTNPIVERHETRAQVTPLDRRPTSPAGKTPTSGISFSVPKSEGLIARLGSAIRHCLNDLGHKTPPLRPAAPGELRLLLKDEALLTRLKREFVTAAVDFKRDPRGFLIETLRGERSSQRRRRLLQAGFAMAVILYASVFTTLLLAGLMPVRGNKAMAQRPGEGRPKEGPLPPPVWVIDAHQQYQDLPRGDGGFTGGSLRQIRQAHGGGGGGRNQVTPPSRGVLSEASLLQQVVLPDPAPPVIQNPTLLRPATIYADPQALRTIPGLIGDPHGVDSPPSSGPGKNGGIGTGNDGGVGPGDGGGYGPGRRGNTGGGDFGPGGGLSPGNSGGLVPWAGTNGVGRPIILYREKAKYTEEARQDKIMGVVVLSAVFTADGRIAEIRVVRSLQDGLTEKAIEAAQKIRFKPATKNGEPISVRMQIEYNFAIY